MGQVRDQGGSGSQTKDVATSAGILVRVSSDGQDEQNQLPELDAYCYDQNYRINKRYNVHDRSAFHGEHEAWLDEALEDIRAGVISVLVVVHSSRLDRRTPHKAASYLIEVIEAGGRIESVREPMFGKDDLAGEMITLLARHSNHDYSKALSGHVRASHNRIRVGRATGKGLLGRAPFGYEIQGDKYGKYLVPTPLGLKYVPGMYDRIIDGESLATVAKWLNSENVPTGCKVNKSGEPTKGWTASTVRQIIRNRVYKGQMRDSNHELAGPCEAIVSVQKWEAAGKRLDAAPKRGPQDNENRAMLTSVLFCECGSPMYRSRSETRVYYRCAGKVTGRSCIMIRLAVIDAAVDQIMSANPEPVMKMTLVEGKNYEAELDLNKAQVKALDMDAPGYDERYAALMAERAELKNLDTIPDTWELRPTGTTWGGLWDGLGPADRSRWLARQGFIVRATKMAVTVSQGDRSATIPLDS